jgi:nucleotide-binding universal stress UspA family protein
LKAADHLLREPAFRATIEQRKGRSREEILKAGGPRTGCDLIAMTTHGRSGPSRWVFGSVTAKVLRSARSRSWSCRHAVTGRPPRPEDPE